MNTSGKYSGNWKTNPQPCWVAGGRKASRRRKYLAGVGGEERGEGGSGAEVTMRGQVWRWESPGWVCGLLGPEGSPGGRKHEMLAGQPGGLGLVLRARVSSWRG